MSLPTLPSDFSSDRPKTKVVEDELGRGAFAGEIARRIRAWRQGDSLVIGLMGPWGCGKTTLKNFVVETLRTPGEAIGIVEFQPWRISGHGSLTEAFFHELTAEVGKFAIPERAKRLVNLLRAWSKALAFAGPAAQTVAAIAAIYTQPTTWPAWIGAWITSKIFTHTREAVDRAAEMLEESKKPMSERKRALDDEFKALKNPILVVIDDIDRLTHDEICEVFQLVKVNADFPNLVYLLMFDRALVSRALNRITGNRGGEFLEKIVQVSLHVPAPPLEKVHNKLRHGLNTTLGLANQLAPLEQERWNEIWPKALAAYFQNLRRVDRFLGSLGIQAALVRVGGQLEVNPIDFIAVEVIRTFEPTLYEAIPKWRSLLLGDDFLGAIPEEKTKRRGQLDLLLESVPKERRSGAFAILEHLFPNWNGEDRDAEGRYRHLRVCSATYFNRYFLLTFDPEELTQAETAEFLNAFGDASQLSATSISLYGQGKLREAIQRASLRIEEIPAANAAFVITGLANVADSWEWEKTEAFQSPLIMAAAGLVGDLLERISDVEERFRVASEGFGKAEGVTLLAWLVRREDRRRRDREGGLLFHEDMATQLRTIALHRITLLVGSRRLAELPLAGYLLTCLKEWSPETNVPDLSEQLITTPTAAVALLRGRMSTSSVGTAIKYDIDLNDVGELMNVEKIEALTAGLSLDALEPNDRRALRALRQRLNWRREGKPDSYLRDVFDIKDSPLSEPV